MGLIIAAVGIVHVNAQEVDREIPEAYEEKIAPLLVPLQDVLSIAEQYYDDEVGLTVLREDIRYITEDGENLRVKRRVYRANSDAGVEEIQRDRFTFRKERQKITLIEAQTLLEDGSVHPVRDNAAILQDVAQSGDANLYEDRAELILVFPKVAPGAITESIVFTQEEEFRVPGEYMSWSSWTGNVWPQAMKRRVVELPNALAERLNLVKLGSDLPGMEKIEVEGNRTRFVWVEEPQSRDRYETSRAPSHMVGPAIFETTWQSWDDLAAWYQKLLVGRSEISGSLAKDSIDWTEGLSDEGEIIERLYDKVANDVRYVGMEFGLSGLQPYSCSDVWENRYGDCKDKSNLLRVLLQERGIPAYMALVETDHVGRVDKRSPNYQMFDHAIVAVQQENGWLFLDPTIDHAPAGTVGQWVANREALVLKEGEGVWAKTPDVSAGRIDYRIEVELDPTGSLSGWGGLTAEGYYASSRADRYSESSRDSAMSDIEGLIQSFYARAEVVDLERDELQSAHDSYDMRAFFVAPFAFPESGATGRFSLGGQNLLLPNTGDDRERDTPFFLWKDTLNLEVRVTLPEGWRVSRLPAPIKIGGGGALEAEGRWSRSESGATGSIEVTVAQSEVAAEDFAALFNGVSTLTKWLEQSMEFVVSDEETAAEEKTEAMTQIEMPIMPTGKGQLRLVDQKFPTNGDIGRRRAALHQVMQFFPDDLPTRFEARANLAYLTYIEDQNLAAVEEFDRLFVELGDAAEPITRRWAEYIRGLSLVDTGTRATEGEDELERLARLTTASDYRRWWSAVGAANSLQSTEDDREPDLERALQLIELARTFEEQPNEPLVLAQWASLKAAAGEGALVQVEFASLIQERHPERDAIFERVVTRAREDIFEKRDTGLDQILTSLDHSLVDQLDSDLRASIDGLGDAISLRDSLSELSQGFRELLAENPPPYLADGEVDASLETVADFESDLDRLSEAGEPFDYLATAAVYVERFEPTSRLPFFLWRFLVMLEFRERPEKMKEDDVHYFEPYAELANRVPDTDDNFYEIQFLRGLYFNRQENWDGVVAVLETMLENPNFPEDFEISARTRLGEGYEGVGKLEEALKQYHALDDKIADFASACDALLRAGLIELELGDVEAALETFDQLREVDAEVRDQADYSQMANYLLALTVDPDAALEYWAHSETWWPQWKKICLALPGVEEVDVDEALVGLIPDTDLYTANLDQGVSNKDGARFFRAFRRASHLARWSPDLMSEMSRLVLYGLMPMGFTDRFDLRAFVIAACENVTPTDETDRGDFYLYQAVALADNQQPDVASDVIEEYFEKHGRPDSQAEQSLLNVWVLSALQAGGDTAPVIAELEALLESDAQVFERGRSIQSLADLYRSEERLQDELAFLETEIGRPAVQSDPSLLSGIRDRVAEVRKAATQGTAFTGFVQSWLEAEPLPWFESSHPRTLEDPRIRDLDEAIDSGIGTFGYYEDIKMRFLAAMDESLPLERRWVAFDLAVDALAEGESSLQEADRIYWSVVESQDAPDPVRASSLVNGMVSHAINHDADRYAEYQNHPLFERTYSSDDLRFPAFERAASFDPNVRGAYATLVDDFLTDRLDQIELSFLNDVMIEALTRGFTEEAEALKDGVTSWRFAPGIPQTPTAVKLGFIKMLKAAREIRDRNQQLSTLLKTRIDLTETASDALITRNGMRLPAYSLSEEDAQAIRLRLLSEGHSGLWEIDDWISLCAGLPTGPDQIALSFEVLDILLETTDSDDMRALLIPMIPSLVDTDQPEIRLRVKALLKPWEAQSSDAPLTWEAVRYLVTRVDRRAGETVDLENAFAKIRSPFLQNRKHREFLEHGLAKNDPALLERTVDELTPDELVSTSLIHLVWLALERLEREDELELVKDEAVRVRDSELTEAWAAGDRGSAHLAIALTKTIGDPDTIPDGWIEGVNARHHDRNAQLANLSEFYEMVEDWSALETVTAEALEKYPSFYSFYGYRAKALHGLGRDEEAVDPLKIYLRFCNDEYDYPAMEALLEEIEG